MQTLNQWQNKLKKWAGKYPEATLRGYKKARPRLIHLIQSRYLSGQVLNVRTGNLRATIEANPTIELNKAHLKIGTAITSKKGFPYGAYWFRRGRDFLNPAIEKDLSRISKMVLDEIMKAYPKGVV